MICNAELELHQLDAIKFLCSRKYGFLNYHTGSGKSLISIVGSFYMKSTSQADKCILVSPPAGVISISEDFIEHTDVKPVILKELEDMIRFLSSPTEYIAICGYTLATKLIAPAKGPNGTVKHVLQPTFNQLLKQNKIVCIFDEFHTLKNPKSNTTKYWSMIRKEIDFCYGVTATSYFQELEDFYHLAKFLDKDFFGTLTAFRNNYCEYIIKPVYGKAYGRPVISSYKNLDLLKINLLKIMKPYTPALDVEHVIHRTPLLSREEYIKASKGLSDTLESDKDEVKTWSARLPNLQRATNKDPNKKYLFSAFAKQYSEKGFICYCALHDTVDVVKEILDIQNIEYREISGNVSKKERVATKNWFNSSPQNKCLIITDAGGQSLNLQSVNNLICYDLPFGIGKFIQIRGRIVRQFSLHEKFYIHLLLAEDTIDEYKYSKITQLNKHYDDIFGLSIANKEAELTDFNSFMIDHLKKQKLWKKK